MYGLFLLHFMKKEKYMKFPESVPAKNFPDYDAMNDGNIRNRKTGRIMKPQNSSKGFKTMTLRRNTEAYNVRVARVIADSFYDDDHSNLDICYRDGNKPNTSPANLIFCTRSESVNRSFEDGRREFATRVKVRIIETGEVFRSIRACAIALGDESYRFSSADCLHNPSKTFMGYHFEKYIRDH